MPLSLEQVKNVEVDSRKVDGHATSSMTLAVRHTQQCHWSACAPKVKPTVDALAPAACLLFSPRLTVQAHVSDLEH